MCIRFLDSIVTQLYMADNGMDQKIAGHYIIVPASYTRRDYYIIIRTQVFVAKNRNNGLPPR